MASKVTELRNLGDAELVERLDETKAELFNLRFQHVTGQLDNHARLGELRRQVARLNTLMREREIAAAEAMADAADQEGRRG
jgi:large subunit ribosomal protein L29